jgi:hypothetical protein
MQRQPWGTISSFLSLDLIRPYLRDMDVPIQDEADFRNELRRALLAEQDWTDPEIGQRILSSLQTRYGREFVAQLDKWAEDIFSASRRSDIFLWSNVIDLVRVPPHRPHSLFA